MTEVDEYVRQAEAEAHRLRNGLRPGDDVGQQIQAQRRWSRLKGKLDAADEGTVTATAQKLIATASSDELPVVAEELPAYLEGRSVSGDFVDDALGKRVPEYGQAVDRVRVAHKQRTILRHDAAKLGRQFRDGFRSEVGLLDPREMTAQPYGQPGVYRGSGQQ